MVHPWLTFVLPLGWALLPRVAPAQATEMRTARTRVPDVAAVVERLIRGTTSIRHQEGRPLLAPNPQLTAAAQDFAAFMSPGARPGAGTGPGACRCRDPRLHGYPEAPHRL